VTDRKQTENELKAAREKLQNYSAELEKTVAERTVELREALAQLESFSYSISHDLRAPLRAINGFVSVVLKEHVEGMSAEGKALLERVAKAGRRLAELIEEVLGSAHVNLNTRPVALSTLVPRVIEDYPNLRDHRSDIIIEEPLLPVSGTEPLLTQCIANLLNNAIKFRSSERAAKIRVWTEAAGENVKLHVSDNGLGIAKEDQARLFEMFSRGVNAYNIEGSGVGLAIVKRAVERMGGKVGVHSYPEDGSDFWIELRAATLTEPAAEMSAASR
jgi:signal transduction histidine kinase